MQKAGFLTTRLISLVSVSSSLWLVDMAADQASLSQLQFYADSFETLQMFLSWSEDMHVVWILFGDYYLSPFLQFELSHF